jgi:2'-5' RNA ligase
MSRVRTFVAVPLADDVRGRVAALQTEWMRLLPEIKWVEEENLHVTLVFLGEVEDRELPKVCQLARQAVADREPFTMGVGQVGCFPNPRRPRVLWAGVGPGAEEVVAVHDGVEAALETLGFRREDRRYTPHITLGRTKSDGPVRELATALDRHAAWQAGEMVVDEIHIMGSELTRNGPRYTVLGRATLGTGRSK